VAYTQAQAYDSSKEGLTIIFKYFGIQKHLLQTQINKFFLKAIR